MGKTKIQVSKRHRPIKPDVVVQSAFILCPGCHRNFHKDEIEEHMDVCDLANQPSGRFTPAKDFSAAADLIAKAITT